MNPKEKSLDDESCMDRCRFETRNCSMNEDGTWDCSVKLEDCFARCRIR
jgi:hypothetical protein